MNSLPSSISRAFGPALLLLAAVATAAPASAAGQTKAGNSTAVPPPATPAKPTTPAKPDAIPDGARAAWDALPLADRKAMQDALIWLGLYNGTVDGTFGRNTYEALKAFETSNHGTVDGTVDTTEKRELVEAGATQRKAAQFTQTADPVTGAIIGVPLALVGPTVKADRGTQWIAKSKSFAIETASFPAGQRDLAGYFAQLKADTRNGRKVDYAVLKPDWFVMSGETASQYFYIRYATNDAKELRGFAFTYDKPKTPQNDILAIAIANSFDPFATPPVATVAVAPDGTTKPTTTPNTPATTPPLATIVANPNGPTLASGLVLSAGKVITVAKAVAACKSITVGKAPATIVKIDPSIGLALLDTSPAEARPSALAFRPASPGIADLLLVMGYSETAGKPGPLVVAPGETLTAAAKPGQTNFRVLAPLQRGSSGAVVTDRSGALVALVSQLPAEPRQIAGIVPQMPHDVVTGTDIAGFLTTVGLTLPAPANTDVKTAAEIVALTRPAVVPVVCTK